MKNRTVYFLLILILLLGFGLRLYDLGEENFWYDELLTQKAIENNFSKIFKYLTLPLYFCLLWPFAHIFGFLEFSLRFPSLIFGILSIFMIFKLATLLFDKKVGLISALILAINSFHIYYAQEARVYTLFVFLTLGSVYFLVKSLRNNKIKNWFFYILFTIAVINTHYWGFLLLFTEGLYSLIFLRKKLYIWFRIYVIISISCVFWLPRLVSNVLLEKERYPLPHFSYFLNFSYLINLLKNFLFGYHLFENYIFWIFIILFLFGLIYIKKWKLKLTSTNYSKETILLLLWLFLPLILIYFLNNFFKVRLSYRYFIFITPAFYILISKGLVNIGKKKLILNLFLILIVIISFVSVNYYYSVDTKVRWGNMLSFINKDYDNANILILSYSERWQLLSFNYYYNQGNYSFMYTMMGNLRYGNLKDKLNCDSFNFTYSSLFNCPIKSIFLVPSLLNQSTMNFMNQFLSPVAVHSFGCKGKIYTYVLKNQGLSFPIKIIEDFETKNKNWDINGGKFYLESDIKKEGNYSVKVIFKKGKVTYPGFIRIWDKKRDPLCLDITNFWSMYKFLEFDIYPENIQLDNIDLHIWNRETKSRLVDGNKNTLADFYSGKCELGHWCHIKIDLEKQLYPFRQNIAHITFYVTDKSLNEELNIFYLDNITLS